MSERTYGDCTTCRGTARFNNHECGACGGTGYSGDAVADPVYYSSRRRRPDVDRPSRMSPKDALEIAIGAILESLYKKERKDGSGETR